MPRHNIFHNLHNITCGQYIVHSRVLGTVLDYQIGKSLALALGTKSLALALALTLKSLALPVWSLALALALLVKSLLASLPTLSPHGPVQTTFQQNTTNRLQNMENCSKQQHTENLNKSRKSLSYSVWLRLIGIQQTWHNGITVTKIE